MAFLDVAMLGSLRRPTPDHVRRGGLGGPAKRPSTKGSGAVPAGRAVQDQCSKEVALSDRYLTSWRSRRHFGPSAIYGFLGGGAGFIGTAFGAAAFLGFFFSLLRELLPLPIVVASIRE